MSRLIPTLCLVVFVLFESCSCSCGCEYKPGDRTLTAWVSGTDNVLEQQVFNYEHHVGFETLHIDSINSFRTRHLNDSISDVTTVLADERIDDLNCKETKPWSGRGWICACER